MGLLPIFLSLALFVFLWSLVNYNSFAARKEQIRELVQTIHALNEQRRSVLASLRNYLQLRGIEIPASLLQEAPFQPYETSDERVDKWINQWERFQDTHPALMNESGFSTSSSQLNEIVLQLIRQQKNVQATVNEYDHFRKRMPFRLIATLFGFNSAETLLKEGSTRSFPIE